MRDRFSLFYAGFTSYAPSFYFNQKLLIDKHDQEFGEGNEELFARFYTLLEDLEYENNSLLVTAISIADYFKIQTMAQPLVPDDYFKWIERYNAEFEKQFPPTRIDYYYYLYAQKIASILTQLGLIKLLIDLKLNDVADKTSSQQISTCLKTVDVSIFKMTASSALLSGEPRQNYFRLFHHEISSRNEKLKKANRVDLNSAELQQLREDSEDFRRLVTNGFKKCILLLKKLGV